MANIVGDRGTFNETVGVKVDMDEAVDILSPSDVPLQQILGVDSTVQVKVEWMDEDLMGQYVVVDDASVTGTGTSGDPWTFNVDAGTASELRVGDILWNETNGSSAVQYRVETVNTSTDEVTVTAFAGNATAPANDNVLKIVGQYRDEGSEPEDMRSNERNARYNYTEIFQEGVEATRTARRRGAGNGLYGKGDPYDHEVMKKFKELGVRFERALIHGQRAISADAKRRSMGGLFYYISTNTASNTKANAKTALNSLLRQMYNQGAPSQTLLLASPAVKEAISLNVDASLRQASHQTRKAGFVVDKYMSDVGEIDIAIDRHLPTTKAIALTTEWAKVVNFDGFAHELLAKTRDGDNGHIVGEKSLQVKNEKAFGILTITDAS
jgi:hypothetical protein